MNEEQKLNVREEQNTICNICGGNVRHEEIQGRGMTPKKEKEKHPNRKISWKYTWDVYTCDGCGNIIKHLRR